jgi:hypothetical protein
MGLPMFKLNTKIGILKQRPKGQFSVSGPRSSWRQLSPLKEKFFLAAQMKFVSLPSKLASRT